MWASYKGHVILVQEFLERGADPNVKAEVSLLMFGYINTAVIKLKLENTGLTIVKCLQNLGQKLQTV